MKVGIIGCGNIAKVHAQSILAIPNAELVGVCDCKIDKSTTFSKEYGGKAYADYESMITAEELDVVHICTPHHLHTPMILTCLEKGIHVFAEKPPVISFTQFEELSAAYQENSPKGIRLAICFQNRLNADVQFTKELLRSSALGKIQGIRGMVSWCRNADYYNDEWHGRKAMEGGGALINQGIHTLDLLQYLVDKPCTEVKSLFDNFHLQRVVDVEDTLCAYLQYPEAVGNFYVTTGYVDDLSPQIDIRCEQGKLRLENGAVTIWASSEMLQMIQEKADLHDMLQASREGANSCIPITSPGCLCIPFPAAPNPGKACWGAGHFKAIAGFYESIQESTEFKLDYENVKETIRTMLKIYKK